MCACVSVFVLLVCVCCVCACACTCACMYVVVCDGMCIYTVSVCTHLCAIKKSGFKLFSLGGTKFLENGIFMKFATDLHGLYGGEGLAMKV